MEFDLINGQVVERSVSNQVVTFYEHPTLDHDASLEAGERKYVLRPYVKIVTRGSNDVFSRAATEHDFERYRVEWEIFTNEKENGGTPLNKLPLAATRVLELSLAGYQSVEQLAESDEQESKLAEGYLKLAELTEPEG